jgi:CHAD domain-containing protein
LHSHEEQKGGDNKMLAAGGVDVPKDASVNGPPRRTHDGAGKSRKFRLERIETVPEGIKRIAIGQIDRAVDRLRSESDDLDESIHDARVCAKKIRAILRLVRGEIGRKDFKRENLRFRDAARRLSHVRDTAAMVEALDKLRDRYLSDSSSTDFDKVRGLFIQKEKKEGGEKVAAMSEVSDFFLRSREIAAGWPIASDDFSAIKGGLRLTYKQGRQALRIAYSKPSAANFHEWRKQVKWLWYQVKILTETWPKMLRALANEIGGLADHLSDEHDLALLREALVGLPASGVDSRAIELVLSLIARARIEARASADVLGRRIYAERPRLFVERFAKYWKSIHAAEDSSRSVN